MTVQPPTYVGIPVLLAPFSGEGGAAQAPHAILGYRNNRGIPSYHPKMAEIPVYPTDAEITAQKIHHALKGMSRYIVLGGDHAITLGILRARAETEGPIHLVLFDAHSDDYVMDDPDVMNAGNWLRFAKEEGLVSGITWFHYREFEEEDDEWEMSQKAVDEIPECGPVHVSVDIDVLRASEIMWATNYAMLYGCEIEELIDDIWQLPLEECDLTFDIVEYDPTKDINHIACGLAATIMDQLLEHVAPD